MSINSEIILLTFIGFLSLGIILFKVMNKKKRSAKNIYKLIDDLEKKYIY